MGKQKHVCEKCGKLFYTVEHHLLPKALFGEGETKKLCPTCHDEFHRYLGHKYTRKEHKQSMEFYIEKYLRWIAGFVVIIAITLFSLL